MRQQAFENVKDIGNIFFDIFLRSHRKEAYRHERVVPVTLLFPLKTPVDVGHRLLQVVGHKLFPVGSGQPGQEVNDDILNVGVFAKSCVLADPQHQLTELTVSLL